MSSEDLRPKVYSVFGAVNQRVPIGTLIILLLLFAIWNGLSRFGIVPDYVLASPASFMESLSEAIRSGELFGHMIASLQRVFVGFTIAMFVAVPTGVLMGWSPSVGRTLNPIVEALRPVSSFAYVPIGMMIFGLGFTLNAFVVYIASFFPILINTIQGVRGTEKRILEFAKLQGARPKSMLFKVALPSALPSILTGLRVGMGIAWMSIIATEMIGAKSGLGFLIYNSAWQLEMGLILVGVMAIAVIGLALNRLFLLIERKALSWRDHLVAG
ncbi:MAG: ABC transporter permease [Actinobacteria bacterium]|nr:ABC transporter permease [Actinomycetota bacterium]